MEKAASGPALVKTLFFCLLRILTCIFNKSLFIDFVMGKCYP